MSSSARPGTVVVQIRLMMRYGQLFSANAAARSAFKAVNRVRTRPLSSMIEAQEA